MTTARRIKTDRGGVITNLDNPTIPDHIRREVEDADRQAGLIEDAKDEARKHGGGDFFQAFDASETEALANAALVSSGFLKKSERDLNEDAIRPLRRIANDPSSPFGFTWVLLDRDAQSVNEWRHCPFCLQVQKSTTNSQCEWKYQNAGVRGCGYNRIAEEFFYDKM